MRGIYDIHCHILPGVDDGSKSMEESKWMLRKEYEDGVRRIIVTPHFRYDMFEPSMQTVKKQFLRLQAAAAEVGEDLELFLGCELHVSMDMVSCLKKGERLTMAGSRYVLVEFGNNDEKSYIKERIQKLKLNGYLPIIAHAERYRAVKGNVDFVHELKSQGALIQVNADSISGKDGLSVKWFTKKLLKQELVDFIGTDGHGMKSRVPDMGKCYAQVLKTMGEEYTRKIFVENPKKITG